MTRVKIPGNADLIIKHNERSKHWSNIRYYCKTLKINYAEVAKSCGKKGILQILKENPKFKASDFMAIIAQYALHNMKTKEAKVNVIETLIITRQIEKIIGGKK